MPEIQQPKQRQKTKFFGVSLTQTTPAGKPSTRGLLTTTNISKTTRLIEPKIINISSRDLSKDEMQLLKRGLKFTPTPQ